MLVVALVAFVAMAAWSISTFPSDLDDVDWPVLLGVGLVGPLVTIWLNGEEFRAQARLLGLQIPALEAIRISALSTAANLLPLPGSVLVRTGALTSRGVALGTATRTSVVAGVTWIGTALVVGGVGIAFAGRPAAGLPVLAIGLAAIAGAVVAARSFVASNPRAISTLVGIELGLTLVNGARFYLVLMSLGVDVTTGQALSLTVAGAVASAAGIFPSGIGLREGLAGLVAGLVELDPAVGVGAAALDRVAGLVVLSVVTAVLLRLPDASGTVDESPQGAAGETR